MKRGLRHWWIAAMLGFATVFVVTGMALSGAHADAVASAAPRAAPRPAAAPARAPAPVPVPTPAPAAAADPADYAIRRVLTLPGPLRLGDYYWDESGAPADGPVVITADLKAQTISVFRAGYEIGVAAMLYGADDKPTPLGVHPIMQKKVHHISNLYGAPMPYMQRLTADGVAIHGTPRVAPHLATHGCLGVPDAFARLLFGATRVGDKVIITDGETLAQGGAITALR